MEKILVYVDYANIASGADNYGVDFDYIDFLNYVSEGRFLIDAQIYIPIDPRNEHKRDKLLEELWLGGYLVNKKIGTIAGKTYKCNFDVEMTMDIITAIHNVKPDIIVLASGDGDFVPLVTEIRKHGIRVEVASFTNEASRDIMMKASGFINLDIYSDEISNSDYENDENKSLYEENLIREDDYIDESDIKNEFIHMKKLTIENESKKEEEEIKRAMEEKIKNPLIEEFSEENNKKESDESEIKIEMKSEYFEDPWDWEDD